MRSCGLSSRLSLCRNPHVPAGGRAGDSFVIPGSPSSEISSFHKGRPAETRDQQRRLTQKTQLCANASRTSYSGTCPARVSPARTGETTRQARRNAISHDAGQMVRIPATLSLSQQSDRGVRPRIAPISAFPFGGYTLAKEKKEGRHLGTFGDICPTFTPQRGDFGPIRQSRPTSAILCSQACRSWDRPTHEPGPIWETE